MALAILSTLSVPVMADDALSGWSISGLLDLYYQYDFGRPGTGPTINFRQFDNEHNNFTLAAVQLTFVKKAEPFGVTLQLAAGKNADILNATEPAGPNSAFKYLQQAYVGYAGEGFTVDFGKFLSWIGYEGIESPANDNYSRSFLYFFAQPIYHVGLRGNAKVGPVNAGLYLVNGWNEAEDSNANKSYGASASFTLGKGTVAVNYYGGVEGSGNVNGFGAGGKTAVNLGDLIVAYPITDKVKLAINADYGDAKGVDGGPGGKFYGIAGYVAATLSEEATAALRVETVTDKDGLRSGIAANYNSFTGTLGYALATNSLLRVEVRFDTSNRSVFNAENGGLKKERTTLSVSHAYRF